MCGYYYYYYNYYWMGTAFEVSTHISETVLSDLVNVIIQVELSIIVAPKQRSGVNNLF